MVAQTGTPAMGTKRKALSKKMRFEVFKRDKFTCQYCGRKAPDVILNADHLEPVAKGGRTSLLNLITACFDCNSGKSDRRLSDDAELTKQRAQMEELQERRQQIEWMAQWRKELAGLSGLAASAAIGAIEREIPGRHLTDSGRQKVMRWVTTYGLDSVLRAAHETATIYLKIYEGETDIKSVECYLTKIPKFCGMYRQEQDDPNIRRYLYIQGIVRKINDRPHHKCVDLIREVHDAGVNLDWIEQEAKSCYSASGFEKAIMCAAGMA
jgi:hypothetical protein